MRYLMPQQCSDFVATFLKPGTNPRISHQGNAVRIAALSSLLMANFT
jgi:hypothetical protein